MHKRATHPSFGYIQLRYTVHALTTVFHEVRPNIVKADSVAPRLTSIGGSSIVLTLSAGVYSESTNAEKAHLPPPLFSLGKDGFSEEVLKPVKSCSSILGLQSLHGRSRLGKT